MLCYTFVYEILIQASKPFFLYIGELRRRGIEKSIKRNKLAKRVYIGLVILILTAAAAMVFITGRIVFNSTSQFVSNDEAYFESTMEYFKERGFDYDGLLETYNVEKAELISSYDGHTIPAELIYADSKNNDTVILIHGLGGNRIEILPFASIFLEYGYNVLTYDQRSAGENYAPYTTLGYLESYDTADTVAYLDGIIDPDNKIHIWGTSAGAATAGMAVSRGIVEERVSSLILDCPISSNDDIARLNMNGMNIGIPLDFLMFSSDIYYKLTLEFFYSRASAEECLKNSTLPVLILASKSDETAPFFMAEKIHAAASDSTLVFVEDSSHGRLFRDYPEWYEEQILLFLDSQSN